MLENRQVDLVIPNEEHMNKFLIIIIKALNTVDGNRDQDQR